MDESTSNAPTAPVRGRGQAGVSLLESLLAVMLASVVVVALAGGFLTMIRATGVSSDRQRLDSALTSLSESVKAASYRTSPAFYRPCTAAALPTAADYQADYAAWSGHWVPSADAAVTDQRILGVEFWDPTAGTAPRVGQFVAGCPGADRGAQRLTVTVTVHGRTATGQVVIRP